MYPHLFHLLCSLSPHNSMEGSPRMVVKKGDHSQSRTNFQTTSTMDSQVSLGKKTIRNYTPKESSNMLKEMEENRRKKTTGKSGQEKSPKAPVDRMIDDFHRNLPTPPPDPRELAAHSGSLMNLAG